MKQRILNIIAVLFLMVGTATAQSVSIADFEARPGRNTSVEINVNGVSDMTALQFNLSLPAGFSIYEFYYSGGETGDVMSLQPLKSGDYLVVIYNIYLKTFGEDLSLPISLKASTNGGTFSGSLYNVRMSTVNAVSHKCDDVSFNVTVNAPVTGIDEVKCENGEVKTIYDLQGRKVDTSNKGLYIINGKKVFVK